MPATINKQKVVFSVTNCICHDQRILKMAETVSSLNSEITIVGRKRGDCCKEDSVPFKTKRFRMLFNKGFLFYKFFNLRLFFFLLFNKCDLLVANDLDTLLPNYLVSKIKRLPLVYDSHEYFTEVPELQNRPFVKWVWKSIEKMIFPRLKFVMTVSEPIANQYEEIYRVAPLVIRNVSRNADYITPFSRKELGVASDDLLLITQGTGINIDKGVEELIEAVNTIKGVSVLIVGSGDVLDQLKSQVKKFGIRNRIKFIPTVPWETLIRYTKVADAGLCLEKDTNLNYRYSLPNKLFNYIAAGIPVIANDLPETGKIIREHNIGVIIDRVTPLSISEAISELQGNSERLTELRKNAVKASLKINWDIESKKVTDLYSRVLSNCGER
jgi:glycosyltransferase involved in cell wall biosynthesis